MERVALHMLFKPSESFFFLSDFALFIGHQPVKSFVPSLRFSSRYPGGFFSPLHSAENAESAFITRSGNILDAMVSKRASTDN